MSHIKVIFSTSYSEVASIFAEHPLCISI